MEEVQQRLEAEGEKDDVGGPNIAINNDGNSESDDQKARAGTWRVTGPARRSSRGNWTEEEDKVLQAAVERFRGKCWKKIAECLPNRTDVQCLHRWQKVLNPHLVKGPWTKEEDDLIVELVRKHGRRKWSELAKHLPGRIGKQCRERWHNHLNPEINKNPWSREEELILIEAHSKNGNKWADIAKILHGRSENAIKNHWNCSLKKKLGQNLSRSGFDQQELSNSEVVSDSCSGDSILGYSEGRKSYLQVSRRANSSTQASNSIELPSRASTGFKRKQDKSDNENEKSSGDYHRGILKLSNVITTKQVHPQSSWYNYNQEHLIKSPFNRFSCPYELEPPLLNSPQGVIDGSKNADLTKGYDFSLHSELEHGSPVSKDWSNLIFIRPPINSSLTFGIDGSSDEQKITKSTPPKSLAGSNRYPGMCYEPVLQEKDLKIFLSTGNFPSTDSYLRVPSGFTTLEDVRGHEKRSSNAASSCPESILRRAALSFQKTPSIIRKPRLTKHAGDDAAGKHIDSHNRSIEVEEDASPQKTGRLVHSSAINSVGKSLEDAFNVVWDMRK